MELTKIVGFLCFSITILFATGGLTAQVAKNYKRKSTEGVSLITFVLQTLCFFLWSWYGYLLQDNFITGANVPGMFVSLVILFQFRIYNQKT